MKCPHCGQEHPDNTKYCPNTGKKIEFELLSCPNPECVNFGKHILPKDSKFCPDCGMKLNVENEQTDNFTSKEDSNPSVLFVTYEDVEWNEDDSYKEDTKKVRVFNNLSKIPVFEGFYPKEYVFKEKDGHDVLYFRDGFIAGEEEFNEICVLGIKKGLKYEETLRYHPSAIDEKLVMSFKKQHPCYEEVIYIGFLKGQNKHIYVGGYSDNIKYDNPNGADVLTDTGEILFKIRDGICPIEILEPKFLVVGKNYNNRGVMDLQGNLLIKCENVTIENPYPNIVWDSHRDGFYNLVTRETYEFINDFFIRNEIDDELVIISRKSQKVLLKTNYSNLDNLKNEWYESWNNDHRCVLINGRTDAVITLDSNEYLIRRNYYFDNPSNEDCFISDNRLITTVQKDNSTFCEDRKEIRIRDFEGRIINSIARNILIKDNYKYGKAIALNDKKEIVYLDLQGNIHSIPNAYINGEPSDDNDVNVFFTSKETIVINDYDEEDGSYAKIINIHGDTIFDNVYCIKKYFSDKYLTYLHNGKWGVVDNQGNIILRDLYDDIDILK